MRTAVVVQGSYFILNRLIRNKLDAKERDRENELVCEELATMLTRRPCPFPCYVSTHEGVAKGRSGEVHGAAEKRCTMR